ncbi:MAG TPA: glycerophosphodiester phosphodiesterase family protein [bacterium]|nr:glycerophosphodiester phosphodiesterase family protein [bacterium]
MGSEGIRGRRWWGDGRVVGVAHRGASRYAPENTLPAFRLALDEGAAAVECDVQRTQDGHVVVIHDQIVDRTTDGRGAVAALTLEALRRLDAGRWFGPAFAGATIPTLDELLDLVRGRALLQIEIKNAPTFYDGIERQVLDGIRRRGMEEDVLLMSFDHQSVRIARDLSPRSPCGIIYAARLVDAPAAARAAGADALCLHWAFATEDVVAGAHRAGLRVLVWTVDDEAAARRCLALGVDGITSNDPPLLRRVLPA